MSEAYARELEEADAFDIFDEQIKFWNEDGDFGDYTYWIGKDDLRGDILVWFYDENWDDDPYNTVARFRARVEFYRDR